MTKIFESDWFSTIVICFLIELRKYWNRPIWTVRLQDAPNRIGQMGRYQWKMSKNNHYQMKCLFAKDFWCKTFPLQKHLFYLQDHTINLPEKNNIIFLYWKLQKCWLRYIKNIFFSKFLAFCHFVIETINWKWDFVSYNSGVIGLVFQINRALAPITPRIVLPSVLLPLLIPFPQVTTCLVEHQQVVLSSRLYRHSACWLSKPWGWEAETQN